MLKAGKIALAGLAYDESVSLLKEALRAEEGIDDKSDELLSLGIQIRLALRNALFPTSNFEEIQTLMEEARALAASLRDPSSLHIVERHLVGNLLALGKLEEALPKARDLVCRSDRDGPSEEAAASRVILAQVLASLGRYAEAEAVSREILDLTDNNGSTDNRSVSRALARMWALWCAAEQGRFEESKKLVLESQSVLGSQDPPFFRILAGIGTGLFWLRFGEYELAAETLRSVLPMTETDATKAWHTPVISPLGLALVRLGQTDEALPLLETAIERTPYRYGAGRSMQMTHLAECYLEMGQFDHAARLAKNALAIAENTKEAGAMVYALRAIALVSLSGSAREDGVAALQRAKALAEDLSMKPVCSELNEYLNLN